MRDFAGEFAAKQKNKRSRQEKIDKVMCRPGYSWNETLKKCLPPAGYGDNSGNKGKNPPSGPITDADASILPKAAGAEVAKEAHARKSQAMKANQ